MAGLDTIILPLDIDRDKLVRTADVAEKLFAPMVEVFAGHQIDFTFEYRRHHPALIKGSIYEGINYDVFSIRPIPADFSGTMLECLEFIASSKRYFTD